MDFVNNGEVSGVTLLNSKFFHMNMYQCKDMLIKDVTVTAPGDSPNTDGIHMGDTSGITITNTVIGVGDDCISIGPGTSKVNITGVTCGPGHGIFIDMMYCPNKLCTANGASKVTVKDVTFKNITGTSSTPEAISLLCTAKIQCTGVTMDDVNVEYSGTNNKTMDICTNTKGCTKGCLKELACF
ncbi:Pectin lyase-like superfamily protein [Zea mays]|uniref:Pectin lyase-like superfamily protein n=1 Tax=Zea mays TaxID=4577 RepID=A0A1D6LRF6_MAIZE|nr:Pectin lyase-like superfamily protein [Zea mays]